MSFFYSVRVWLHVRSSVCPAVRSECGGLRGEFI